MAQAADFFVSNTGADRAWAEWIAGSWRPRATRWWSRRGTSALAVIGLIRCGRPPPLLSGWWLCSRQPTCGRPTGRPSGGPSTRRIRGERGLLLPVRVGEVEPPGLLKTRVYVDTLEA
jgi:hypothetical protein